LIEEGCRIRVPVGVHNAEKARGRAVVYVNFHCGVAGGFSKYRQIPGAIAMRIGEAVSHF